MSAKYRMTDAECDFVLDDPHQLFLAGNRGKLDISVLGFQAWSKLQEQLSSELNHKQKSVRRDAVRMLERMGGVSYDVRTAAGHWKEPLT